MSVAAYSLEQLYLLRTTYLKLVESSRKSYMEAQAIYFAELEKLDVVCDEIFLREEVVPNETPNENNDNSCRG